MKAVVSDHHIELEGCGYFVGKAGSITIGAWGDKKSALEPGKAGYLEVWDVLSARKLAKMKLATTALVVDFRGDRSLDLVAALSVSGLASGKVGLKATDFASGKVTLVRVSPSGDEQLIDQLNASPKVIDKLVEFGSSARVVVDVLIAVEAELYSRFAADAANNAAVLIDGLMQRADREPGWHGNSEIRIGPGTVIGYSLAEPRWNTTHDKSGTQVTELHPDRQALQRQRHRRQHNGTNNDRTLATRPGPRHAPD